MTVPSGSHSALLRSRINAHFICNEDKALQELEQYLDLPEEHRRRIEDEASELVRQLRRAKKPGMMETFLGEYGLSTEEGVALMCLAEALLRVPDEDTIDALIQDKIAPADWARHVGHSSSPLVNASTWALMLTGKVIAPTKAEDWDVVQNVRSVIRRVGEPVIRKAVAQAMKILGHQFVLGRTIAEAVERARGMEQKGYQYSYDMLGEAARTGRDAKKYFLAYSKAITGLSERAADPDIRNNPGISVKFSALHPRYEFMQWDRVMKELVPRVSSLVQQAKNAQMGFNVDAEEADRLDLSLDVIEAVLSDPDLAGWDGFGVVVQAYSPRAFYVLDWLYDLSVRLDRRIMVRLVKGAYWDTEIKLAQVGGLDGYPVFTRKAATDVSYMACARKLLSMTDRIYPQFATHNAHSVSAILELAGSDLDAFEFQRLHGMGEALHDLVRANRKTRCRIYAPVGVHEDLLAYLVRRLLENGANSSFVNQVLDEKVPARHVVRDPVTRLQEERKKHRRTLPEPAHIYDHGRQNSAGINLPNPDVMAAYEAGRTAFRDTVWQAGPIVGGQMTATPDRPVYNPARLDEQVGLTVDASEADITAALELAGGAGRDWAATPVSERSAALGRIADLMEENRIELMSLLMREAGKSVFDAINELREAVDFCRFYELEAGRLSEGPEFGPCGTFVCISPWNFPLAIFTGQIVAALVTGNAVIAKPAEQTPLVAARLVGLMHRAGIPGDVLHLLPGDGAVVGARLVSSPDIDGVCFTGSTETARLINRSMAAHGNPFAPLIAETGGLNAMIVDSTALPEQAVRDIVASAFQSAGQRCSALRVLYVQEDVAPRILEMLEGAMDELCMENPWNLSADLGPVIDAEARDGIADYCREQEAAGRLIKKLPVPARLQGQGYFVPPTAFRVTGIAEMEKEVFGPVLHVATYKAGEIERVVEDVNRAGYGLTMGLHTRVDGRVQDVARLAAVGNLYVNRNQIGAVVGVQPFGGEGLSGTGPKAGGPLYLHRFLCLRNEGDAPVQGGSEDQAANALEAPEGADLSRVLDACRTARLKWEGTEDRLSLLAGYADRLSGEAAGAVRSALTRQQEYRQTTRELNGPTGEANTLDVIGRGVFAVVGAGDDWADLLIPLLLAGNGALLVNASPEAEAGLQALEGAGLPSGIVRPVRVADCVRAMGTLEKLAGVVAAGIPLGEARKIRQTLADRDGPLLPLLPGGRDWRAFVHERALCVDTTASGGNAALLASVEG
ncbi:bifunctional proline dehydrogenase/L-glutamate gamma-semialdehyde dehydrogenase PutA [Sneathiella chinensis]|uniref:Bifunctional protein PutA n=1 Tax=Sneathiella chinensis TaxID=349750 RepID=A0ABQ5U7W9_9PROT|nr:bifunctional proline dehydrogenase/L-glutamate gamma-semialdehyde dehydrogenase PutA [Sneathiella chinensis]GLQ07891.1 bifunctional protein PutA [Sneathiella chinensis]